MNCHKANYISHAVLNSVLNAELILFQEPWVGRIGTSRSDQHPNGVEVTGFAHQTNWNQFAPISFPSPSPPRVVAYTRRNQQAVRVSLRSDIFNHPDIMALEVLITSSGLRFLLINIYNDDHNTAAEILTQSHLPNLPILITGDFNLHHPMWSGDGVTQSTNAENLVEWMISNGLVLINEPGVITFERGLQSSVIDLTWVSASLIEMVRNWHVAHDADFSSDHYPITMEIVPPHSPAPVPHQPKYIFKDEHQANWSTSFTEHLSSNPPPQPNPCSVEQLTRTIEHVHEALRKASDEVCTSKLPSCNPSPWYTNEVKEALRELRAAKAATRKLRRLSARQAIPQTTLINTAGLLRAKRKKLRRTITKAKRDWALHVSETTEPSKIWSLTKWYQGLRRYAMPALNKPQGGKAVTSEDKAQVLRASFFPPTPPVFTPFFSTESQNPATRPFEPITQQEIEQHLKSTSNSSAPGSSGISYRALKWAWKANPNTITYIIHNSIRLGFHHSDWKKAITVVLPKPNKPTYDSPRSYRPVQLLECLGKLVEKVVAKRLMFECSRLQLIPPEQFGGVASASCPDAGLVITHDIHEALNRNLTASLLTVDVKGFFDSINHNQLCFTIYEMGFPLPIVKWVSSFLSNRHTALRVDDFQEPMCPTELGVPQGSPVSPILSVIYTAPILKTLRTHLPTSQTGFQTQTRSYIDDFAFLVASDSAMDNIDCLTHSLSIITRLLHERGMVIDPTKSELIHFSRAKKPPLDPIRTSLYDLPIEIHPATESLRWLGIFFDRKLSFDHHRKIMVNRATTTLNGIKLLANTVRGMQAKNLLTLVKTCIIPILTYAFPVWFNPQIPKSKLLPMDVVLNKCASFIAGTFRTTPRLSNHSLSHLPPILATLTKLWKQYAARLLKLPLSSLIGQRLPDAWRLNSPGEAPFGTLPHLPHNTDTYKHLSPLLKVNAEVSPKGERIFPFATENSPAVPRLTDTQTFPNFQLDPDPVGLPGSKERKEWANKINMYWSHRRLESMNIFFCDGSRKKPPGKDYEASGAAMIYYGGGKLADPFLTGPLTTDSVKVGLGKRSTAYDGEMLALLIASRKAIKVSADPRSPNIFVFLSDSTSALRNIVNPGQHPGQTFALPFIKNIKSLLAAGRQVQLLWSPGHSECWGNEEADRLAKEAAESSPSDHINTATQAYYKETAKRQRSKRWRKWNRTHHRSPGSKVISHYKCKTVPTDIFKSTSRELWSRASQALTNHGYLGTYYQRFNLPGTTPWCRCSIAGPVLHSREHIARDCPRHNAHRHIIEEDGFLYEEEWNFVRLGDPARLPSLLNFSESSGAFTKLDIPFSLNLILPPPRPKKPP